MTQFSIAVVVAMRLECPFMQPSPKNWPGSKIATTASLPCSEMTVSLTLPCWMSYCLANGQKFHDVDAAFTALIFRNKRLRLMKAISQFALGQTCGSARVDHK